MEPRPLCSCHHTCEGAPTGIPVVIRTTEGHRYYGRVSAPLTLAVRAARRIRECGADGLTSFCLSGPARPRDCRLDAPIELAEAAIAEFIVVSPEAARYIEVCPLP